MGSWWRGWRWWLWIYESSAGGWCFVWRGRIWHIKEILAQDTTIGAIYGRMSERERQQDLTLSCRICGATERPPYPTVLTKCGRPECRG